MDGRPVWLCSVSRAAGGRIKATGTWTAEEFAMAERLALSALAGVGDAQRQRAFRMNVTFCVHRAVSEAEGAALPACWADAPGCLAGGPVEALWSRGIEHRDAAMPCRDPRRILADPRRPDLWLPVDCGLCPPCLARARVEAAIPDRRAGANLAARKEGP
jgi:hypothetical protein